MTDKEIIEIDGINVLECEHYQYKSLKDCEMRYPESGDCEIGLLNYLFDGNLDMEKLCKDNPNCDFKQLARKTQECEQIKEKYEALKLENQEGYEIVAELKHECEELKKELNGSEKWRIKAESLNEKLSIEKYRYRKALEEIEEHYEKVVKNLTTYDDSYDASISIKALHNISDIINKAKGEGDAV